MRFTSTSPGSLLLAAVLLACGSGAHAQRRQTPTPKVEFVASRTALPNNAIRYRPSGALRAYRITEVEGKSPTGEETSTKLGRIFDGAILYQRDTGIRIVPSPAQAKASGIDYIEVRGLGTGFAVNTDNLAQKNHLYVSNFKFTTPKDFSSSATANVDTDAESNYIGAAHVKKQTARLHMKAEFVADVRRSFATPSPEGEDDEETKPKRPQTDTAEPTKKPARSTLSAYSSPEELQGEERRNSNTSGERTR